MLATRKFMQRKRKEEVFKDAADEAEQKNWRRMMREIEERGSAVSILKTQRSGKEPLPRDVILGTLMRFKQLKKWNIVSEVYFHLQMTHIETSLVTKQLDAILQYRNNPLSGF